MEPLQVTVKEEIKTEDGLAKDGRVRYEKDGALYSIYPPTAYLTFSNWIYMVPPYKPKSVLMLGYAGGTVAGLIKLLYGEVPITAVDIDYWDNRYGVDFIKCDARDALKISTRFDCVILDIFIGQNTPSFVYDHSFAERVAVVTKNFLIIHASPDANIGIYEQFFTRLRLLDIGHKIYYFKSLDSPTEYFPK